MSEQQTTVEVLTAFDIESLNVARGVLRDLEKTCRHRAWDAPTNVSSDDPLAQDLGRVAALAEHAETAIFDLLNNMNAHRVQKLTAEQLHNRNVEDD